MSRTARTTPGSASEWINGTWQTAVSWAARLSMEVDAKAPLFCESRHNLVVKLHLYVETRRVHAIWYRVPRFRDGTGQNCK